MRRRNTQSGYVLVVAAFTLVVLLGFSALAIDVGVLYGARTAAQRAADAAALAGALTFITSPSATDPVGLATNRAMGTATQNQILRNPILPGEVSVAVDYDNRRVTVDVTQAEDTYFAKALFLRTVTVHAQGIAEASEHAVGSPCVKPWFIPNSVFSLPGVNACGACASPAAMDANLIMIPNGDGTAHINRSPTMLPLGSQGKRGGQFTVKPGNPSAALGPGQFFAIDLWGSPTGGDDYREAIARCDLDNPGIWCLHNYSVKTGNMIGPTRQGVEGGSNLTQWLMATPPDTWAYYDTVGLTSLYYTGGNHSLVSDTSVQLVVAPLWNVCTPELDCSNPNQPRFGGGTNVNVPVIGFALIFVEGMGGGALPGGNNDVIVRLIDVLDCGSVTSTGNETGPLATPLRLVRVN